MNKAAQNKSIFFKYNYLQFQTQIILTKKIMDNMVVNLSCEQNLGDQLNVTERVCLWLCSHAVLQGLPFEMQVSKQTTHPDHEI